MVIPVEPLPLAPTTTAAFALAYAAVGWRSFPVRRLDKRPSYPQWQKDATTDPALIDQYFGREPVRNVGLLTGLAFDAWDIEGKHLERFLHFMRDGGYWLPETPVAITGRDGRHIFTLPTGVNATRKLYLGGVHIGELKSTGGYIVAPPSEVEHDGRRTSYSWQWAPTGMTPAPAPAWLLTMLDPVRPKRFVARVTSIPEGERRLDSLVQSVRDQAEGSRNLFLYWATLRALEEGVPDEIVGPYMAGVAHEVGLPAREAGNTIDSARARFASAPEVADATD